MRVCAKGVWNPGISEFPDRRVKKVRRIENEGRTGYGWLAGENVDFPSRARRWENVDEHLVQKYIGINLAEAHLVPAGLELVPKLCRSSAGELFASRLQIVPCIAQTRRREVVDHAHETKTDYANPYHFHISLPFIGLWFSTDSTDRIFFARYSTFSMNSLRYSLRLNLSKELGREGVLCEVRTALAAGVKLRSGGRFAGLGILAGNHFQQRTDVGGSHHRGVGLPCVGLVALVPVVAVVADAADDQIPSLLVLPRSVGDA